MYQSLRPLIFRLDPERAHNLTVQMLRLAGNLPPVRGLLRRIFTPESQKPVQSFGLTFPNPVGLAAGYDKDGLAWPGLACLGFGHIEVGTVTPRPQAGNPRPRIFRIPSEQAVINRMGFPGRGADFVARRLSKYRGRREEEHRPSSQSTTPQYTNAPILGLNIGKNKVTPNEEAAQDYLYLTEKFAPLVDYLAVNVSSPNTVGLRRLQARDMLTDLLSQLDAARHRSHTPRPILVKLAPDLSDAELDDALDAIIRTGMDGVIATNTTISRERLHSPVGGETGGLSGAPLRQRSTEMIAKIHRRTAGNLPIIGVGGITSPRDAKEKLAAGATLVQVYTGLIYRGPGLVREIVEGL
ncbi:MAG: quinone-dependent dihydroorotate dehydrogenase [Chloroflexota bacterium]|nr:quinone-dependent dihydroorotate dehydrogenase [Chloroflexota bacterium]